MGNLQTLCQNEAIPSIPNEQGKQIESMILENRKQLREYPRAPLQIQQLILKLTKNKNFDELYKKCKIWKVRAPYNFCYINQPENGDKLPCGICSIYLYKEKGDFLGFYRGKINEYGLREVKNCIYIFVNGDYFQGDKEKSNYGIYIDKQNKFEYTGDWANGKPHGQGRQISSKGTYTGYFKNGKKTGNGKFEFSQEKEIFYEGDFHENQMTGNGKLVRGQQKYTYEGQFLNGEKHGKGIQKNQQFKYQGEFYCDKKSGNGKLSCGKFEYEGEFFDGVPHGKGLMKKKEKQIEGIWEKGKLVCILDQQK